MSNAEVFRNYFSEDWVIEENLCYLLHEYDEARKENPRINKVGFIKNFLKMKQWERLKQNILRTLIIDKISLSGTKTRF